MSSIAQPVAANLRSQLDAIERQLIQLTIKQRELAAESPSSHDPAAYPSHRSVRIPELGPAISTSSEMRPLPLLRSAEAASHTRSRGRSPQTTKDKDEYLMDLISHPICSRPVSATNRSLRNTPRAASAEISRARMGAYEDSRRIVVQGCYDDDDMTEDDEERVAQEDLSSRPSSGLQFFRKGHGRYPPLMTITPRGMWSAQAKQTTVVAAKKPLSPLTAADYVEAEEFEEEEEDESFAATEGASSSTMTRDAHELLWLFERKLIQEKKRLDQEFQAALNLMKGELQETRKKRQADRDEFLKQQLKLEKQSKEAKAEITRLSEKLIRNEDDIKTARMMAEDRVREIERLEYELNRTLARLSKSQGRHEELQVASGTLRQENAELVKKLETLQEAQTLSRSENARLTTELEERRKRDAERAANSDSDLLASRQLVQKLSSELTSVRVERSQDEALIVELSNSLDRLQERLVEREQAHQETEGQLLDAQEEIRNLADNRPTSPGVSPPHKKGMTDENEFRQDHQLPDTDDPSGTKSSSASSPQAVAVVRELATMQTRVDELEALYERAVRELEVLRAARVPVLDSAGSSELGGKFVSLSRPSSRRAGSSSSKTRAGWLGGPRSTPLQMEAPWPPAGEIVRRDDRSSIVVNFPFVRSPTADSAPPLFKPDPSRLKSRPPAPAFQRRRSSDMTLIHHDSGCNDKPGYEHELFTTTQHDPCEAQYHNLQREVAELDEEIRLALASTR